MGHGECMSVVDWLVPAVLVTLAVLAPRYGVDSRDISAPPVATHTPWGDLRRAWHAMSSWRAGTRWPTSGSPGQTSGGRRATAWPEVVCGSGKTTAETVGILEGLLVVNTCRVLATQVGPDVTAAVSAADTPPDAVLPDLRVPYAPPGGSAEPDLPPSGSAEFRRDPPLPPGSGARW